MKLKKILAETVFLLLSINAFCQLSIQSQQILMPKKVYIGDTAELRCSFNSDSDLFKRIEKNETRELPFSGFTDGLNSKHYDIKDIKLSNTGMNYYTLTITFVPWKTGVINLPAYDVVEGFSSALEIDSLSLSSLIIKFEPITIVSLTDQSSIAAPKGALSPLLLPGTTYKIYALLIVLVLILIALSQAIIKHKKLAEFIKNQKLLRKYKKNKKLTLKELNTLLNTEKDDKETSAQLQRIMRNYLEVRFEYPFTKCGASEILSGFYKATCSLLSDKKYEAAGEIAGMFVRTDFIRYSNNSFGKEKSAFNKNEKQELIEKLVNAVEILEAVEIEIPKEAENV